MAIDYFKKHVDTVNSRVSTSAKAALEHDEVSYPRLFTNGMIDRTGDLSTQVETITGGGMGIYGSPAKSNLNYSTDFPVIQGEKSSIKSYSDGFMMISKVSTSMGSYISNEKNAVMKLQRDVDALFVSHAIEDDRVLMGLDNSPEMTGSGIFGIQNSPEVGRVDSTLGDVFENSSATEIYNELKLQLFDFVQNVDGGIPAGSRKLPTREISLIVPIEIYLILAMTEVTKADHKTELLIDVLTRDVARLGGLKVISNAVVGQMKHTDPANNSKVCIIGYFDKFFLKAKIPYMTSLLSSATGSHIDHKTNYESLFVSKNLGIQFSNINVFVDENGTVIKRKPLRILQGI